MKFDHAAQSLRDGFFKLGQVSTFNDPFECRGRFVNLEIPLRSHVHDQIERLRFEYIRNANLNTPEEQAKVTEDLIFEKYLRAAGESMRDSWLKAVDATVLMMCFVNEKGFKPLSDVLFWSHYADAGNGIRISFDLKMQPRGGLYYMKEVEYVDEVPVFDCKNMTKWLSGQEYRDYIERLSHLKGKAWEYENEVRMIFPRSLPCPLRDGAKHMLERTIDGHIRYFAKIGYEAIRRVDYGPRVDRDAAGRLIKDLLGNCDSKHIQHFEAMLSPAKYEYLYKRVA